MPIYDAIGNVRSRRGADIANAEQRDGFWPLADVHLHTRAGTSHIWVERSWLVWA
jgi:hypothetical protein